MSQDFDDFQQARQEANRGWRTMKDAFDKAQDGATDKVRDATHEQLVKLAGQLASKGRTSEEEFVDQARRAYRGQQVGEDRLLKG